MTIYILGGGPTGMAICDGLVDSGEYQFVLIEKAEALGGLAQTLTWGSAGSHDLGPHKIYSLDKGLTTRVESLLKDEDWLTQEKISSIFMNGYFLPYPPSPFSLAGVFGISKFLKMVIGYGYSRLISIFIENKAKTFEEDLEYRVGKSLYETLFKPIAIKLWGNPRTLDVKLSRGRVQTPSILEILGRMMGIKKGVEFEALTFRYPKGGLGNIWRAIQNKSHKKQSGTFLLNHSVIGLDVIDGKIVKIHCNSGGRVESFIVQPNDHVVSTLPLGFTVRILKEFLPAYVPQLVHEVIELNDLILVFFHANIPSFVKESWIFIPDSEIIFHRLSEQKSFDPKMTPNGTIICCEIMSNSYRTNNNKLDKELIDDVLVGLKRMGFKEFPILSSKVIRLPKSYPVFKKGFEDKLDKIIYQLDQIKNFRSIGRQGSFNYIGTLDAMDIGYGYVRWISGKSSHSWGDERERTNHYPILD